MYRIVVMILLIYALYLSQKLNQRNKSENFQGDCLVPLKYDTVDKAAQRFTNFTLQLKDGILDGSITLNNGLKHTGRNLVAHNYVYLTKNPAGDQSRINSLLTGPKGGPHSICLNGHHKDSNSANSILWSNTQGHQIGL